MALVAVSAACDTRAPSPSNVTPVQSAANSATAAPLDGPPHPDAPTELTEQLPEELLTALAGCWATDAEQWEMGRESGSLVVRRRLPNGSPEAARASLPATVRYSPTDATFGFTGAGRIHELLFVLRREGDALVGRVYTRRAPTESYRWTGNAVRAERCRAGR